MHREDQAAAVGRDAGLDVFPCAGGELHRRTRRSAGPGDRHPPQVEAPASVGREVDGPAVRRPRRVGVEHVVVGHQGDRPGGEVGDGDVGLGLLDPAKEQQGAIRRPAGLGMYHGFTRVRRHLPRVAAAGVRDPHPLPAGEQRIEREVPAVRGERGIEPVVQELRLPSGIHLPAPQLRALEVVPIHLGGLQLTGRVRAAHERDPLTVRRPGGLDVVAARLR